jgi:hypothetical protein
MVIINALWFKAVMVELVGILVPVMYWPIANSELHAEATRTVEPLIIFTVKLMVSVDDAWAVRTSPLAVKDTLVVAVVATFL